ncbi:ROK family transcriptional regulator [Streptomyces celluloflavus]|uniref:ROK family transcriptional regulator n=1 Tax=Streptomyces celluloflavus TaxID=58344 RepID=UPI00365B0C61
MTAAEEQPGSAAHVLELVANGSAASRADLVRELGLAASTVSARVQELVEAGLLSESGEGASRGGRRPRLLRVADRQTVALAADLGSHHVRTGAVGLTGGGFDIDESAFDLTAGPGPALDMLTERLTALAERQRAAGRTVRGVGIGFPGPVDADGGRIIAPSRMPGWHLFALRDRLADRLGLPVLLDNDANVLALGEHRAAHPALRHLVVVKAGRGIGSGVISGGRLYRGARGSAGDISHVRVDSTAELPCSCGNIGCLETVASGAAIAAALRGQGIAADSTTDILRLVENGEPHATTLVRQAGRDIGAVLAVVVNFFNPEAVILGGALSGAEPLVAAVRGMLYERCLPMATRDLVIDAATCGPDAGLLGAGHAALRASAAADGLLPAAGGPLPAPRA